MANNDDNDLLDGLVPDPGAEATPSERTHAKAFADLIDKAVAGRTPPAAMSADDRALLEVATVIRAASGNAELAATKRSSLVETALRQAIGGQPAHAKVTPISRGRAKRFAPWIVAGMSMAVAAAAIVLWLASPRRVNVNVNVPATATLPENWKSRPTDSLIGPIERVRAGDASARIDTIFADRLDGYREIRLRGGHTP